MANDANFKDFSLIGEDATDGRPARLSSTARKIGGKALEEFLWKLDPTTPTPGQHLCELAVEHIYEAMLPERDENCID